jgi:hypothetical protein
MKYNVKWSAAGLSPVNIQEVEALNPDAAKDVVQSMYGSTEDFRIINVSASSPDVDYSSYSSSSGVGGDADDPSTIIATGGIIGGVILVLFGLFTLPVGIFAMILGGAAGWLSWKLACWVSDRGW